MAARVVAAMVSTKMKTATKARLLTTMARTTHVSSSTSRYAARSALGTRGLDHASIAKPQSAPRGKGAAPGYT